VAPTRAEERELVRRSLQEQAGERRVVAPYGRCGGLEDPARQSDLRVARLAARAFHEARLGATGRELWAGVAVDVATLADPLARAGLVALYAQLDVDGFVVEAPGPPLHALAELVLAHDLQSGRPVEAEHDRDREAVRRAQARVLKRSLSA
jgi:hypothetical protein